MLLTQGDGAVSAAEGEKAKPLAKASFLPKNQKISVRPRSGVETLSSGFQFRFGSDTRFALNDAGIELNEGSLMVRSRKIDNSFTLKSPEAKMQIRGSGCFLMEVETNGGIKAVTVLGRLDLIDLKSGEAFSLLPGELVFVMPGGRGFGEKVSINLKKLITSSYLVSGFPNTSTFQSSLESVAAAQAESIGITYGAEVGDAKASDSFEVVPLELSETANESEKTESSSSTTVPSSALTFNSESDPLIELLGRSPKRMRPPSAPRISTDAPSPPKPEAEPSPRTDPSPKPEPKIEPKPQPKAKPEPKPKAESSNETRPFPSRLLRSK